MYQVFIPEDAKIRNYEAYDYKSNLEDITILPEINAISYIKELALDEDDLNYAMTKESLVSTLNHLYKKYDTQSSLVKKGLNQGITKRYNSAKRDNIKQILDILKKE